VVRSLLIRYGVPGTFVDVPMNTPKGMAPSSPAERFRAANPGGFQIEIHGRRAIIIWLPK
jgi:hypothetical protein